MSRWLVLAVVVPAVAGAQEPPRYRLHVGGQVGFPFVVGISALASVQPAGRPRGVVDLTWEPSVTTWSYSVGGAYHVLDGPFFVGARLRLMQYQPPWARGAVPLFLGLGLELGLRFRVGAGDRGLITISAGGTYVPGQATNLRAVFGLTAGFAWSVLQR